ncbi:hypothetical protein GpartN1_g5591.t1 [Galdieria partita]|uniref:Uncharacterized protein n=1 Tax=Galdieria partita TaxID=83374 RepID=A0A9C7Q0G0_9RHOD|nr:hypothetical protein GpartN1_g5591.t1 [Galdieria partita]
MSRYWTVEEHERFLEARKIYGRKDTKSIAEYVGTRTVTQVRTHTQKYERRLELARRTGGPGFRVRSKRKMEYEWKSKGPKKITVRTEQDSSVSSTSSNVSVTKNNREAPRCHMDTQSPYSIQQTHIYSDYNLSDAYSVKLQDTELYSDDYMGFPSKSGEAVNIEPTDTCTRSWNDSVKSDCPYNANLHSLYSNLPFWQNVIAKSSWGLHRAEISSQSWGLEREEGCIESFNNVDSDDGLCKEDNVLDVDNIESTEDLETALMEYFQRKPIFTSLNETGTCKLLGSSTPCSFRI